MRAENSALIHDDVLMADALLAACPGRTGQGGRRTGLGIHSPMLRVPAHESLEEMSRFHTKALEVLGEIQCLCPPTLRLQLRKAYNKVVRDWPWLEAVRQRAVAAPRRA